MYFIHYSCYKHIGYVWRGIKTNPRPKNSTVPGPPVLKFLDPPLSLLITFLCFDVILSGKYSIYRYMYFVIILENRYIWHAYNMLQKSTENCSSQRCRNFYLQSDSCVMREKVPWLVFVRSWSHNQIPCFFSFFWNDVLRLVFLFWISKRLKSSQENWQL